MAWSRRPIWPEAGKEVCVLERRHVLGGCAATEELWPGYKVSTAAYVISLFLPEIIRELKLKEYGLTILPRNPSSFTPLPDGRTLLMGPDERMTCREIAKFSQRDAERYPGYNAFSSASPRCSSRCSARPRPIRCRCPTSGGRSASASGCATGRLVELYQALGELGGDLPEAIELLDRRGPADSRSLVRDRRAEGDARHRRDHRRVRVAVVSGQRVRAAAPRDGRSGRRARRVGLRARRHGRAGRRAGGRVPRSAASKSAASRPSSGSSPTAAGPSASRSGTARSSKRRVVASSVDAHLTFEQFLDPSELPDEFREAVARIDYASASAKINLALAEPPRFTCLPGAAASGRTITARCTSARRSTTWSGPTTTPSTAGRAASRSSK